MVILHYTETENRINTLLAFRTSLIIDDVLVIHLCGSWDMSIRRRFDTEKAIEVLLFIAERSSNMYHALKILYFADLDHLAKYGRLICNDNYIAMNNGPVPSGVYDLVKYARGDGYSCQNIDIINALNVRGYKLIPVRSANLDLLSESEIECLDAAIAQYGNMSFGELKRRSHDAAYKAADENDFIPIEAIVGMLPDSESLLKYLQDN